MKTFVPKPDDIERTWHLVDANGKVLGRLASEVATILKGKHKPIYSPHMDVGDHVVIVNAEKVRVTGNKLIQKEYQRYTGYHGGQKIMKLEEMLERAPEQVLRLAINRMIPSGPLGNKVKTKLKIYKGENHPHAAQKPISLAI